MQKKRFYFPVTVEDGLSIMRLKRGLDVAAGSANGPVTGFTNRDLAVRTARENPSASREVCLLVIQVTDHQVGELIHGDMVHFGPIAKWTNEHALEFEHVAQDLITHSGHMSLELVTH